MAAHFPDALQSMLTELNLSQYIFAEKTGMSQSMVGKLIHRNERASDDIYAKIFRYLSADTDDVPIATKTKFGGILARALLRDVIEDLQLPELLEDKSIGVAAEATVLCPRGQAFVGDMFCRLPDKIILALFALGNRARGDQHFSNLLYAQAEIANESVPPADSSSPEKKESRSTFFPRGFFTKYMEHWTEPKGRLLRGRVSDLVFNLRHRDAPPDESH